ncbi:MAG: hypothetical protein ACI8TL_001866 [Natronomonas sp.]|jgi:hypothetical protein
MFTQLLSDERHAFGEFPDLIITIDSGTFMVGCYILSYMESDTVVQTEGGSSEVMAAVEDGPREEFILADINTDEAYVSMPLDDAASLPAWR